MTSGNPSTSSATACQCTPTAQPFGDVHMDARCPFYVEWRDRRPADCYRLACQHRQHDGRPNPNLTSSTPAGDDMEPTASTPSTSSTDHGNWTRYTVRGIRAEDRAAAVVAALSTLRAAQSIPQHATMTGRATARQHSTGWTVTADCYGWTDWTVRPLVHWPHRTTFGAAIPSDLTGPDLTTAELDCGPVANPDGSPSDVTRAMLAGTGRDPEQFAAAVPCEVTGWHWHSSENRSVRHQCSLTGQHSEHWYTGHIGGQTVRLD